MMMGGDWIGASGMCAEKLHVQSGVHKLTSYFETSRPLKEQEQVVLVDEI